jgi:hypothetical protein
MRPGDRMKPYRLDELATLAAELSLESRRVDATAWTCA